MILMKIDALQFQLLTIQEETLISIEGNVANASCRLIDVRYFTIHLYRRLHLI